MFGMTKVQRQLRLLLTSVVMFFTLGVVAFFILRGCQSTSLEVPLSASYSQQLYHEAGFLAMDGGFLEVFTLSPEDLLLWRRNVEVYTDGKWERCPAESQILEFLPSCPPGMLEPSGGTYIILHQAGEDAAEMFYISASGECWWYGQW